VKGDKSDFSKEKKNTRMVSGNHYHVDIWYFFILNLKLKPFMYKININIKYNSLK